MSRPKSELPNVYSGKIPAPLNGTTSDISHSTGEDLLDVVMLESRMFNTARQATIECQRGNWLDTCILRIFIKHSMFTASVVSLQTLSQIDLAKSYSTFGFHD
jgi:hypothetical protein